MRDITPIEKVVLEKESDNIGGMIVLIWGEQGSGKTMALTKMVKKDLENQRIPLWKGQESCQWILPAAQGLPITLWIHDTITDYEFFLTGSRRQGIEKTVLNLEEKQGLDIQIKSYSTQEELVERLDTDRVNVYYIPGSSGGEKEKYFFQHQSYHLCKSLNQREYGDHVTLNWDEVSNEASSMKKGDFYNLQTYMFPSQWEDFRKGKISLRGTGHGYSDVNHKLYNEKATGTIYMQGAPVQGRHKKIDQGIVNSQDRGEFVVPGFETGEFKMPKLPHEVFDWIPETNEVRLQMKYKADIPDVRPDEKDVKEWIESQPFTQDHLDDLIDADEAAEITDYVSRVVKRKFQKGEIPAIKLNGKWFTSMTALVNEEDVPS